MQKIAENKVQQYGLRGKAITLPVVFANDNNVTKGDLADIYRDQLSINGSKTDCLIITFRKNKKN